MSKIVKFENSSVEVQKIEGVWMFELYSVGMALGQIKKNGKGDIYPAKDRIDKNVKNGEIKPCVRNAHKYLTESQVYDLMLETRTDKCRAFRKWLTNEVLPELNRTGTYSVHKDEPKQLEFYEYFDKTYNKLPVLTVADVGNMLDVTRSDIYYYIRRYLDKNTDYYLLTGKELAKYKLENPKTHKFINSITVLCKSGFEKICTCLGKELETPKLFIEDKQTEKKQPEYCLILSDKAVQEKIKRIKNYIVALDVAVDLCNKHNVTAEEMAVRRKSLGDITSELGSHVSTLVRAKLETTAKYKY